MAFLASRNLLLCCLAASASCVSVEFSTLRVDQAPEVETVRSIQVGDSLQTVLDALGAPAAVTRDDEGTRTVLTWRWLESDGWGVSFSVPVTDRNSASVDYASNSEDPQQIQLFFNSDWVLVEISADENG